MRSFEGGGGGGTALGKGGSSRCGLCRSRAILKNMRSVSAPVMLRSRPSRASLRRTSKVLPEPHEHKEVSKTVDLNVNALVGDSGGTQALVLYNFCCMVHPYTQIIEDVTPQES